MNKEETARRAESLVDEFYEDRKTILARMRAIDPPRPADPEEYSLTVEAARYRDDVTDPVTGEKRPNFKPYPTRSVRTLKKPYETDRPYLLNRRGALTEHFRSDGTGWYRIAQWRGRNWIIDPEGYPLWHVGMNTVTMGSPNQRANALAKYGTPEAWAEAATERLWALGFNAAGGWSDAERLCRVSRPLAQTGILYLLRDYAVTLGVNQKGGGSTYFAGNILPVFDPEFPAFAEETAQRKTAAHKDDPVFWSWMSDNELPVRSDLLRCYLAADPDDPVFTHSLAAAKAFLRRYTGKAEPDEADAADPGAEQEFLFMVYNRYLRVAAQAIRKAAPNQLYAGCRLHSIALRTEGIIRASGYWCDVISLNYYHAWTPADEVLGKISGWTDTPYVITEWYAKGMDACTPESRLTNESGAGWSVHTQRDRGLFYQNFVLRLMEFPQCVGFDWFKYLDNDPDDLHVDLSNRNANKGILRTDLTEYADCVALMDELNHGVYNFLRRD